MRLRYFEQSITREWLTVWPLCDVPPPRAQHGHLLGPRDRDGALGLGDRARRHDAERHHLVMGGVGGVAAAGEAVEPDIAGELGLEPSFQSRRERHGHGHLSPPRVSG